MHFDMIKCPIFANTLFKAVLALKLLFIQFFLKILTVMEKSSKEQSDLDLH